MILFSFFFLFIRQFLEIVLYLWVLGIVWLVRYIWEFQIYCGQDVCFELFFIVGVGLIEVTQVFMRQLFRFRQIAMVLRLVYVDEQDEGYWFYGIEFQCDLILYSCFLFCTLLVRRVEVFFFVLLDGVGMCYLKFFLFFK